MKASLATHLKVGLIVSLCVASLNPEAASLYYSRNPMITSSEQLSHTIC